MLWKFWSFFSSVSLLRYFYIHLITSAIGWIAPLLMPLWCKFHGLMQRICLKPSIVTLALFMKQNWFILYEFCKEEKKCWLWWSSLVISFFSFLLFFLDIKWKGGPRMEVQKFLSSSTEKAGVRKGSSEKADEYAMAHQMWTQHSPRGTLIPEHWCTHDALLLEPLPSSFC